MEDSFRVRVEKTFGSLAAAAAAASSSDTSSSPLNSLWRLTDEEVERREWNRDKDDSPDDLEPKPFPSNLDGFFANQQLVSSQNKPPSDSDFRKALESDLEELDDSGDAEDDDDEKQRCGSTSCLSSVKPDDQGEEEWDIRSSIGLDCTLEYEEDEDAYDKVAVGREEAADRLYMRDSTDYIADINSYSELPNTFRDVARDPRADHVAAKIRLKEDAEAAGNFDSLQESYNSAAVDPALDSQNNTLEGGFNLKSILKRRENQMDSKSEKRVRFDPACKDDCEEELEGTKSLAMETSSMEEALASEAASFMPQDSSRVPEYIRNPSKFTHYSFDSLTEMDKESNWKAYMDFRNLLKGPNNTRSQDDISIALPKSVIFTPMKKPGDDSMKNGNAFEQNQEDVCKEYIHKKGFPIGIAARDTHQSEVCAMEEDEPEMAAGKSSSLQKPGRQYRTKACVDLDEIVT